MFSRSARCYDSRR